MKSHPLSISRPPAEAVVPLSDFNRLDAHFSAVYALAQENRHVFASPLGPFRFGSDEALLPRFVFFGPNTTDASWRVAFLGGFDRDDLRATHALLGLIEFLGRHEHDGYSLNLSFFPLVDVAGVNFRAPPRNLSRRNWARPDAPEIALLERDARASGYHGYVRVETSPVGDELIGLRMRAPAGIVVAPDVELVSSADFEPWPVQFERAASDFSSADGPLSIAEDLPVQPFELTLRIPATWPDEIYQRAVNVILSRFILRYRAFQAYGQHL
jgi:hypothetical protein